MFADLTALARVMLAMASANSRISFGCIVADTDLKKTVIALDDGFCGDEAMGHCLGRRCRGDDACAGFGRRWRACGGVGHDGHPSRLLVQAANGREFGRDFLPVKPGLCRDLFAFRAPGRFATE
jgi:hypothetical protein